LGIEYKSVFIKEEPLKKEILMILPKKNGSEINRLAFVMKEKLKLTLIYDPFLLDSGMEAFFTPKNLEIGLPHLAILSGQPTIAVYHEIRHASMLSKFKKGQPTLFEGHVIAAGLDENVDHLYDEFLSFQEVSTYFQDAIYHYLVVTQPSFKKLKYDEMYFMLKASKLYLELSKSIISFSLERINKAEELIKNKQVRILFKKNQKNIFKFKIKHPNYEYVFNVGIGDNYKQGKEKDLLMEHLQNLKSDITKKLKRLDEMEAHIETLNP
jgi:hypothetical protein